MAHWGATVEPGGVATRDVLDPHLGLRFGESASPELGEPLSGPGPVGSDSESVVLVPPVMPDAKGVKGRLAVNQAPLCEDKEGGICDRSLMKHSQSS